MLQAIVHWSLRYRGIVIALALVVLAYGVWTAMHAKLDVFPDFVPPQVTVQTEAPGLSPEQVETLVTTPIENALNGLNSLETLRSETIRINDKFQVMRVKTRHHISIFSSLKCDFPHIIWTKYVIL